MHNVPNKVKIKTSQIKLNIDRQKNPNKSFAFAAFNYRILKNEVHEIKISMFRASFVFNIY